MNTRQIEYFLAVADELNFTRAAEKLYVSQTAVTQQIKTLEEQLGVRLFERTKKKVMLTPAGEVFRGESQELLHHIDAITEKVKMTSAGFSGVLSVGFVMGMGNTTLPDKIRVINEHYPKLQGVDGSHRVHLSEADYIVEGAHEPLPVRTYKAPSETDIQIAKLVVNEIPDGAVLSLGVGGVPFTVANMLAESDLRDLGCHTGTISDAYLNLWKAGKLTNAKKEFDTGLSTWNLAMGSQEFYDWIAENPKLFHPADLDYVHDPQRIGTMKNVISINGGVQLDLMGQENAESAGTRQLSGIGGQMDFLEGAYRSVGGKGYICINSARKAKDGTLKSNIVPFIPGGSTVSAPRTMIQSVATEYGIANLSGKTLRERAEAMIAIAHPDFRDELEQYAKEAFH